MLPFIRKFLSANPLIVRAQTTLCLKIHCVKFYCNINTPNTKQLSIYKRATCVLVSWLHPILSVHCNHECTMPTPGSAFVPNSPFTVRLLTSINITVQSNYSELGLRGETPDITGKQCHFLIEMFVTVTKRDSVSSS